MMMKTQNIDNLLQQLRQHKDWPMVYMFKFIAPNNDGKVEQIVNLLPGEGKISYNHTPNLKYVSITCVAPMPNAESIAEITMQACSINGVMSL